MQCSQLCHYLGTVLGIGNAKPLAGGVEHFAGGSTGLDEMVHHEGDEELALEVGLVLGIGKELLEIFLAVLEIIGGKAPEIHGNGGGVGDAYPLVVLVEILHHTVVTFNLGTLHHSGKKVCSIVGFADTAANGTALGKGVAYAETYHGIFAGRAFGKFTEELGHHLEGIAVVEVVAIENCKRLLDDFLAHHHGMVRSPGLSAAFGNSKSLRKCIECLETEVAGHMTLVARKNLFTELLLEIAADDPDNLAETGLNGIEDTIVHDALSLRTEGV